MPNNTITPVATSGKKAQEAAKKIDRAFFMMKIHELNLFKTISPLQLKAIDAVFDEWEKTGETDLRRLAYIFATGYHEAFDGKHLETRFTPITESGSQSYLRRKEYWPYIGRGIVQITWPDNYKKVGKLIGVDLIKNPERTLDLDVATTIAVKGMLGGWFTGRKLHHYFAYNIDDPMNARRIINGTDKAELIAGYHAKFLQCLKYIS